ncbi:hypothetical protein FEM48_Zijuj07G0090500 [Ziziphus jujuba var. spinosa]|uniref:EF-hand domain-containing protein n=1 Tax=Ziziphus jujuba var. spinosa TaxID=714518 RepID=A0A978V3Q8_ZIZJJ|nr:hypothetical protein FEM48_Zijuj07G0090500 [Ziziphus jujuba var. spinosa]
MEEIREIVLDYYRTMPQEQKHNAYNMFLAMDLNGDGRVTIDEYVEIFDELSFTISNPRFIRELDKNGDGILDFEEFNTTYDLCSSCFNKRNYHHHHEAILDNFTLLRSMAACSKAAQMHQVQPNFNLMETQQQYYSTPIVSTDRGGRRRAGMERVRKAFAAFNAAQTGYAIGVFDWFKVKMGGMTMTEKILARASEKTQLSPGENVWVNVDLLMTHDVGGPSSIGIFKKEFGDQAKVWDQEKIVIIPDHYIFTTDNRANRTVDILRSFCIKQNINYFYDIKNLGNFKANPDYEGVCHVALAREGHCTWRGTDSHTCTAGAVGQFASGIGHTDACFALGNGKLLLKPHSPDNRALARECKDIKIDRVDIGSCTGSKTEDFFLQPKFF